WRRVEIASSSRLSSASERSGGVNVRKSTDLALPLARLPGGASSRRVFVVSEVYNWDKRALPGSARTALCSGLETTVTITFGEKEKLALTKTERRRVRS